MILARATSDELFGARGRNSPGDAPSVDELYVLSGGGRRLSLRSSQEVSDQLPREDEGDIGFRLAFDLPDSVAEVRIDAAYLARLGQGYTGLVQVVDGSSSELIDMKVLHSSDAALTFPLPKALLGHTSEPSPSTGTTPKSGSAAFASFLMFLWIGTEHVVFGYDHLLFLLGVLLACHGLRQILGILTAFTVAHSVTLSLAALELVPLVSDVVEPLIAASIAVSAFWGKALSARGLLLPMTFAFGLIHGLGFAAGLQSLVDADNIRLLALVAFNLGVELGQVAAALLLLPILAWCGRSLEGKTALDWTARAVGVVGAAIFVWRVSPWG